MYVSLLVLSKENQVLNEQGYVGLFSSQFWFHSVGGNMKFEEDGHLLSQAKRDLSRVVHAFS